MLRHRSLMRLGAVVVLAAIVVVAAILISGGGDDEQAASPTPAASGEPTVNEEVAKLYDGIPQQGIDLGKKSAPATLVEIADLQCPFCADYSRNALPTVVRDYVRPGKLRYELHFRSFLGRDSVRAAGAAAEAEDRHRDPGQLGPARGLHALAAAATADADGVEAGVVDPRQVARDRDPHERQRGRDAPQGHVPPSAASSACA